MKTEYYGEPQKRAERKLECFDPLMGDRACQEPDTDNAGVGKEDKRQKASLRCAEKLFLMR